MSRGAARGRRPLILFGSYITATPNPNDVDIVLIMRNDFDVHAYEAETRALFDHQRAAEVFEASIFWIRPALLLLETMEEFVAHWQIKRDHTRRGSDVLSLPSTRHAFYDVFLRKQTPRQRTKGDIS